VKQASPTLLAFIIFALLLPFAPAARAVDRGGEIVSAELVGRYDAARLANVLGEELKTFLDGSTIPFETFEGRFAKPKNGVSLYKITYRSSVPELGYWPTTATGLVALPDTADASPPLLSYQHGTVFGKGDVPSRPEKSMETRLAIAVFGGQGFTVMAADYFGLGDSDLPNSYFAMRSNEQAMFDMYRAAMAFLKQQGREPKALATVGWSQGGYNNMVLLRRLEQEGVVVNAAVSAAAPVDLQVFLLSGLTNHRPFDAVYRGAGISNMLFAIERYSGLEGLTERAIRPEYLEAARAFYEFKLDFPAFLALTKVDVREVLRREFVEEMMLGKGTFTSVLNDSDAYRWLSRTPFRVYYGGRDEAVPELLPWLAVEYQKYLGKTDAEAFSAGATADHRATYVHALLDSAPWIGAAVKAK
jgi:pimeloyl-ACP methyl ester carboxylesterase